MNCSVEQCDRPVRSKGMCNKHYRIAWKATAHGTTNSRTYSSWIAMKSRCYNPKEINYKYYGGKGVTVCNQWLHDFPQFVKDLGERPENTSLDRIDSNGNYEPGNVRWANKHSQAANRTSSTRTVGISFDKGLNRWVARLSVDGFDVFTGKYFDSYEDAYNARCRAVLKYAENQK